MAAGLSLRTGDIGELRLRLNRECSLRGAGSHREDMDRCSHAHKLCEREAHRGARSPCSFGNGNPRPLFAEKGLIAYDMKVLGKK